MAGPWEFWIDVGGTFTDCIGRAPDGSLRVIKVLSSGAVKGRVGHGSGGRVIVDEARRFEPPDFFRGWTVRLLDGRGELLDQQAVVASDPTRGVLELDAPFTVRADEGMAYELKGHEEAPLVAMRLLMGLRGDESFRGRRVRVKLGTTRGTNALLERKGAAVVYVTTRGFGDLLDIGTQARPELFKLHIVKPSMLYRQVIEVDERIDATGAVLERLDGQAVERALRRAHEAGIRSVAVCLVNAYVNDAHERAVERVARAVEFEQVSVSSGLTRTIKALDRGDTAVLDAYLSPVVRQYVRRIAASLGDGSLQMMTSGGGLVSGERFTGRDSLLSGPAGGVVGFAAAAKAAGFTKAIGFDMGGTSTDVSRWDEQAGGAEYQYSGVKAGVRVVTPMYAIETVAAGGGSICRFDGQRLTVGPESAGADPGPACYGRGGPLTITDVNLFQGKIDAAHFPFALHHAAVERRLRELNEASGLNAHELAEGFTQVANARMAAAIKTISAAKGYDPAEHVLVSFGGAGAQHACAVARLLGMRQVLLHPLAGVMSAWGIGQADVKRFAERSVLRELNAALMDELAGVLRELSEQLRREVQAEGVSEVDEPVVWLDLRYRGEETPVTVREPGERRDEAAWRAAFERLHRQYYGHAHVGRAVEVAAVRVAVSGRHRRLDHVGDRGPASTRGEEAGPGLVGEKSMWFAGREARARVYERARMRVGERVVGPAMVVESGSTIIVDPGWSGELRAGGELVLVDEGGGERTVDGGDAARADPVKLELFNNQFTQIATQMGRVLQRTALSVNVKERLDFSCAILDAAGELVVNAPHIPVHLGAMGACVKSLLSSGVELRPGDAFVSNDPDLGGSHLPDLTVMTPVFHPTSAELLFFTASRAHHAEIGGVRPGSAYPFARCLAEEGVVLRNLRIVRGGEFDERVFRDALVMAEYPSRSPDENVADVRAQLAANQIGAAELLRVIEEQGLATVRAYMAHVREAAARAVRRWIETLPREAAFEDAMDDGARVCVCIRRKDPGPAASRGETAGPGLGGGLVVDFTGSAGVRGNSLNANLAIVQAAAMYAVRCMLDADVPLNAGILEPIELVVPEGMLNPPREADARKHAAVVGGNVEVSQRIVDVIFGALGVTAASQGIMNNFVFGNQRFGYYETICGGAGAGPTFDGASGVHTHMTNTRITDVEVLERQFPVLVRRFGLRPDSGGAGEHDGGDGVVREIEFRERLEVSLLTQRRLRPPFGLAGGAPGSVGENLLRRAEGASERLGPLAQVTVEVGDVLTILTPGGGGFGHPRK